MRRGFTLIELLIVVIIVGLLVTVALPQYRRSAERGRVAVGMAALRMAADKANARYLVSTPSAYPDPSTYGNILKADPELVGVGDDDLFSITYTRSTTTSATVRLTRDTNSGWRYAPAANLANGDIISITCAGADCATLGLPAEGLIPGGSGIEKPIIEKPIKEELSK